MSPNHRLYDPFDKKLQQLFTGGIVEYHQLFYSKYANAKRYEHLHREGPQVLTLKHLEAGFSIWLFSITFAIFAFLLEWLFFHLKFYLIVKFTLSAYFEVKVEKMRKNVSRTVKILRKTNRKRIL